MKCPLNCTIVRVALLSLCVSGAVAAQRQDRGQRTESETGARASGPAAFQVPAMWEYSAPLIAPERREQDRSRAQKDPTVVLFEGKWHVFMTVKLPGRSAIEYVGQGQSWQALWRFPVANRHAHAGNGDCRATVTCVLLRG